MLTKDNYRDLWFAEKAGEFVGFYTREYYCLDNFSAFGFVYEGRKYPTVEHAYQAYKFYETSPAVAEEIFGCLSAYDAQRIAHEHEAEMRPDWHEIKVALMEKLLRAKLAQNPYVLKKLLQTEDHLICEESPKDSFWGIGPDRTGRNELGKLWMKLRAELR